MPFGRRSWPERKIKRYEADLTYRRLLLPVLIDAGYDPMRADRQALMEVIDTKVLHAIGHSRLVIADLATTNPNVMWELGVRHAWHPSGTILAAPEGSKPPFDVARVTVHHYKRGATTISDRDCVEGIKKLQAVLATCRASSRYGSRRSRPIPRRMLPPIIWRRSARRPTL